MQKRMLNRQWTRRDFLRLSAGATGVAALAACVPAGAPGAQPSNAPAGEGPVSINVWTGWTEDAATNIEKILDGFNKSQDEVVANHVIVPEAMTQKLLAAVSAGDPPATAVVFGASIAYQLAAQKALLALDDVGSPDQVGTLQAWMDPAIWELGMYEGSFYYASMWNQCWAMFVNTKMAAEQGVDLDSPPQTLEEVDALWEQLTTYDADGNIDVLGGDVTSTTMTTGRFLGQFVSEDGTQVTANHPNNVRALEWVVNRWEKFGTEKLAAWNASLAGRGERSAGQDPFLSGLRATLVTGPWQFNTLRNFKPADFEFTVWPFPGPAGQAEKGMYTYGDGWIIPVGSPNPSAAWDIISNLTGATGDKDVYTSLFTTWLCVNGPSSQSMTEWPLFQTDVMAACPGYEDAFLTDLYDADYYLYPPKIPTSISYLDLMGAEWEKARLGEKSPQAALDFVQETAQKELDTWIQQNQG
ncbi:MAG: extracellular solute-binding protein [Caldilineaceae bacterium]|nr:extracellular solute-binding protein [Caldilineaceae bacterium]